MPTLKNKVIYGGETLIDLTQDTVDASVLVYGYTAHDKSGSPITGECKQISVPPIAVDYETGYTNSGSWVYQDSNNNHTDVYEIENGRIYVLSLGSVVGTRFRSAQLPSNPVGSTADIKGTSVVNQNNPAAKAYVRFTASVDGWLCVTKDNVGTKGLKTWLFDITTE